MGRLRLWTLAARAHFNAHWSSPSHFWSGILGMFANNAIALGTIWAMLFAGRPELIEQSLAYATTALVNMAAWGTVHVFVGGLPGLDSQITEGALDSTLMAPRSPLAVSSIAASHLPAWGDLAMGLGGLGFLAATRFGVTYFLGAILMILLASIAFAGIFVAIGSIAFWARRTGGIWTTLVMIILSFNSYPIFDALGHPLRWLVIFAPLTAVGVIPARFLLRPSADVLFAEAIAAGALAMFGWAIFRLGLRRYQSTPSFAGQRG